MPVPVLYGMAMGMFARVAMSPAFQRSLNFLYNNVSGIGSSSASTVGSTKNVLNAAGDMIAGPAHADTRTSHYEGGVMVPPPLP